MGNYLGDCVVLEPGDQKSIGKNPEFVEVVGMGLCTGRALELLRVHPTLNETKYFRELEIIDGHNQALALDESSAECSVKNRRIIACEFSVNEVFLLVFAFANIDCDGGEWSAE